MIEEVKTELERIALELNAIYTCKKISEYEQFAQGFNYSSPSINQTPITSYKSRVEYGRTYFDTDFEVYFLTKAVTSDNLDDVKDVLIDSMIELSDLFFEKVNKNENRIFIRPTIEVNNEILRQFTSQYLVGVKAKVKLDTSCNRY